MSVKALVVIPTFNEVENILALVGEIFVAAPSVSILVVDDSSPDGTAEAVRKAAVNEPRLNLLLRSKKEGLGKAYIAGFAWGLSNGFDFIIEMDADFSHRPKDLVKILHEGEKGADFAVGSRYISGGSTMNWGFGRKLISRGGSFYARCILGYPLNDWTGGFNGWNRHVLESIGLKNIESEGYSFQVELKYRASKLGFHGIEVPIIFEERRLGQSKMSSRIVIEAIWRVLRMRLS